MPEQLRILEGATFCICDDVGDLQRHGEGLFTEDTRFLSRWILTINGLTAAQEVLVQAQLKQAW